jgi:hypothetical protein
MTPADVERVFGRSRLQIATGPHVEVFREVARSGEERRYTKRFLQTESVDFRPWTEREYRVLVRLGRLPGAPVAKALELLPADESGTPRLQTRDAGATLDQWATLVPLRRGETTLRNVFDDCANWWALARQCMVALDALHALGFVHLDLKPDNVCIPWAPAGAGHPRPGQPLAPRVKALALIDVAFSLVPEVDLPGPLPLLKEPGYEYQSPRLLHALEEGRRGSLAATRALDWRCDFYSLAAMLWRYLPEFDDAPGSGWNAERHAEAQEFVQQLLDVHNAPPTIHWPHRHLIGLATLRLRDPDLQAAVQAGCTFDPERDLPLDAEPTPPTRIADYVPRPVDVDPTVPADDGRFASAPIPLAEMRREPTVEPVAALPPAQDARREPSLASPTPVHESRREPILARPAPSTDRHREPAVAAIYSAPIDLDEAIDPAPADTTPALPPEPAREALPETAPETTDGADPPAPVAIRPRRRQTAIAAVATGALGVAAIAALWLSIGRSLGPATTVSIPLPSASEVALPSAPAASATSTAAASTPVVVAATPPATPTTAAPASVDTSPATTSEATAPPSLPPSVIDESTLSSPAAAGAASAIAPETTLSSTAAPSAASAVAPAPATAASSPSGDVAPSTPATAPAGKGDVPSIPVQPGAPANDELDTLAADLLQSRIPAAALSAERRLARVLAVAAGATELRRRGDVRTAMQAMRSASDKTPFATPVRGDEARRLNEAALVAYWRREDIDDAVRLQRKAFAANPFDSEVVGNLAFLQLKEQPPRAEAARQLALHALTLNDPRFPSGRIEDWTAFAVASALTGREADARNAWFASMALASDLQHQCNNAVRAEAIYGERLRPSVQAMLQRARSSAAYGRCEAALSAQPARAKRPGATAAKPSSKAPARSAAKPAQAGRRPSA